MVAAQSVGRDRCGPASLVSRASDVTRHMENAQRGESRSTARVPTPTFESGQERMKLRALDHSEDACRRRMLDAGRCNQGGMAWRALVSRHGDICSLPQPRYHILRYLCSHGAVLGAVYLYSVSAPCLHICLHICLPDCFPLQYKADLYAVRVRGKAVEVAGHACQLSHR